MRRTFLAMTFGILAIGGIGLAQQHEHGDLGLRILSRNDMIEKIDGKKTKATMVEVTLGPGAVEPAHRHPGAAFGYILEGEYEWAIDGNPARRFKAGDTFYEPTGCLHRVSRNASKTSKTRILAVVLHPADVADVVIPLKNEK